MIVQSIHMDTNPSLNHDLSIHVKMIYDYKGCTINQNIFEIAIWQTTISKSQKLQFFDEVKIIVYISTKTKTLVQYKEVL